MKKANIVLSVLLFTVIGLLFFFYGTAIASKFLKFSDRALDSYNGLLGIVSDIKDGERRSMPLFMDDNSAIIGISKDSKRFESKSGQASVTSTTYFEKSDTKCEGKSCICLCKKISYEGINYLEGKIVCKDTKKTRCNSFNNIDFLKIRHLTDFTVPKDKLSEKINNWWENGFIILTQTKVESDRTLLARLAFGGLLNEMKKKEKTVYVERYKNYVNVCYSKNCMTDEMKKEIDLEEMKKDIVDFT